MNRRSLPTTIEVDLLTKSARRCALCFGLNKDFSEKKGQIAHLDKNNSNHSISNLVFLCFEHHDSYDSKSSQSKGYRQPEVIKYRDLLYEDVALMGKRDQRFEQETTRLDERSESIESIANRYYSLEESVDVLEHQIMARARALSEYIRRMCDWNDARDDSALSEDELVRQYEWQSNRLIESLSIPIGVYGLRPEGHLSESWLNDVECLVSVWVSGEASYDECTDLLFILDELYDLDALWILYGIPNNDVPRLGHSLLYNFIYVFGLRGQSEHRANKKVQPLE